MLSEKTGIYLLKKEKCRKYIKQNPLLTDNSRNKYKIYKIYKINTKKHKKGMERAHRGNMEGTPVAI
jgi:hypothetical protein